MFTRCGKSCHPIRKHRFDGCAYLRSHISMWTINFIVFNLPRCENQRESQTAFQQDIMPQVVFSPRLYKVIDLIRMHHACMLRTYWVSCRERMGRFRIFNLFPVRTLSRYSIAYDSLMNGTASWWHEENLDTRTALVAESAISCSLTLSCNKISISFTKCFSSSTVRSYIPCLDNLPYCICMKTYR